MRGHLLRELLSADPGNLSLIAENAEAALSEGRAADCAALLEHYRELAPPSVAVVNMEGLLAMSAGDYGAAEERFASALGEREDPTIRYNLALARSYLGDCAGADEALTPETVTAAPGAACLKVEVLHRLGALERALVEGRRLLEQRPQDAALAGALALAALDADEPVLAAACADRGADSPAALSVKGSLALDAQDVVVARQWFERALAQRPGSPRATLGVGLCLLAQADPSAARVLEAGAAGFRTHTGAWVAAGWAHFAQGDFAASRHAFETALALDENFSEPHGGLAVLDFVEGVVERGEHSAAVAQRLDPQSFGGALARVLLLAGAGQTGVATKLFETALQTPIGAGGRTIAGAIALSAFARRSRALH